MFAEELGAELKLLGVDYAFEAASGSWTWWSGDRVLSGLPYPALSGEHQLRNAAGVLKVADLLRDRLPFAAEALHVGLVGVVLSGRFHREQREFEYIMDVAHNPQAGEIFAATLRTMPPAAKTHALVGMLRTKNHREFLRPLLPLVDAWHFADLPGATGASAQEIFRGLRQLETRAPAALYPDIAAAHAGITTSAEPGERIIVVGSFLTVGALMKLFQEPR